ncbi:MAG: hypothetical protein J7L99_00015 [Planctomycetes bacterium]|nr:hypothetical protein [Planctomycetota bacterium]
MNLQGHRLLEKIEVYSTSAIALAIVYFILSRAVKPWELTGAITFVPTGDFYQLIIFASLSWAIAAACAVLTASARIEGAVMATLIGLAGFSLSSGQMRTLLWRWGNEYPKLFKSLVNETILMGGVLLGIILIIYLVRMIIGKIFPSLLWSGAIVISERNIRDGKNAPLPRETSHIIAAIAVELAIAMLMLVITMRSTDRGQIAFALVISFFLASLVAHQVFSVRWTLPLLSGPIIIAIIIFGIAAVGNASTEQTWRDVELVAQSVPLRAALPIDWLTFAGAGTAAGCWLSSRIAEKHKYLQEDKDNK